MGRAAHLLTDTVHVADVTGRENSGDPIYGPLNTLPARVENESKLVIDPAGNERQANHKVVTETEIKLTSRLFLPGDNVADPNKARRPVVTKSAAAATDGYRLFETWL